jgi:integrase
MAATISARAFANGVTPPVYHSVVKPHGLRKTACRRLAEAGCSANEIMAISGHATMKELIRYTKAADQARLARNAMARTADTTVRRGIA